VILAGSPVAGHVRFAMGCMVELIAGCNTDVFEIHAYVRFVGRRVCRVSAGRL
jgi:hypothetical protein